MLFNKNLVPFANENIKKINKKKIFLVSMKTFFQVESLSVEVHRPEFIVVISSVVMALR